MDYKSVLVDYNGYAVTMAMLFAAFGTFLYAIRGEIKDAYAFIKEER